MKKLLVIYNLLFPLGALLLLPAWVLTMVRRGGFGTGLLERLSLYRGDAEYERSGAIYIHAVSVGEVMLARKLIDVWRQVDPEAHFLLVPTTATGHAVALEAVCDDVRVIYSPLDLRPILRRMFNRFEPSRVVLIESELWPNLLSMLRTREIPVGLANARLSPRSERRYLKFKSLLSPLFGHLDCLCVPEENDRGRWISLGARPESIVVTGGLKFDQRDAVVPERRGEFQEMIDHFGAVRPVVMLSSTHDDEEKALAEAVLAAKPEALLLVVPRHEERRAEVKRDLEELGLEVVLRSRFAAPVRPEEACLVVDVTGELRDWTAHADLVIIGKSWLAKGGQSPVEAIAAKIPVIVGPHMQNFSSLVASLVSAEGVLQLDSISNVSESVIQMMDAKSLESMVSGASSVLKAHDGAAERMVKALAGK